MYEIVAVFLHCPLHLDIVDFEFAIWRDPGLSVKIIAGCWRGDGGVGDLPFWLDWSNINPTNLRPSFQHTSWEDEVV